MTNKLSTTNIPGSQGNSYPKAELDYSLDYEYDPAYAHRLIRAGTRYYRYDANGNITAEKDGPFTDEEEFAFTYSYFENEDVYGTDYGFGLDAPKETEQANPQDLFAYRRNYTWNERNLLTKSSDRNFTVHYRYGDDGQRALKYTDEGRSDTLYFNNFFTIHIPTQDQNNPQGLRVHKHIFVGNSRLVTAMTHTDNSGDNEEQKAKRYYYHSDHLGSAQFVTDWKGRQYEHIEYTPYGELWIEEVAAGLDKLPFRFTGKELDEETGLYYYGARYLDPKYSRWLSGDPALGEYIPSPGTEPNKIAGMGGVYNTINLHVYHYAGNNPIKYTDPDGKSAEAAKAVLEFALADFFTPDPSDVAIEKKAIAYDAITVFAFIFITTPNQSSEKKAAIEAAVEEIKRKRSKKNNQAKPKQPSPLIKCPTTAAPSSATPEPDDEENRKKEPASEKTAKKMAERIEKDLGKNARRAFHDLKDGGDRTMQELKQDAADIYEQYGNGKEPPQWMRPD